MSHELPAVLELLQTRELEITRLDAEILKLQRLRRQESRLRTQYMSILSPLRRIPAEILAEIFALSLPSDPEPELGEAPLSLLGVCSSTVYTEAMDESKD